MARSHKRTPIHDIAGVGAGRMKLWHRHQHHRERVALAGLLAHGNYDAAGHVLIVMDEWGAPNDGQHYWGKPRHESDMLDGWYRMMRK